MLQDCLLVLEGQVLKAVKYGLGNTCSGGICERDCNLVSRLSSVLSGFIYTTLLSVKNTTILVTELNNISLCHWHAAGTNLGSNTQV